MRGMSYAVDFQQPNVHVHKHSLRGIHISSSDDESVHDAVYGAAYNHTPAAVVGSSTSSDLVRFVTVRFDVRGPLALLLAGSSWNPPLLYGTAWRRPVVKSLEISQESQSNVQ